MLTFNGMPRLENDGTPTATDTGSLIDIIAKQMAIQLHFPLPVPLPMPSPSDATNTVVFSVGFTVVLHRFQHRNIYAATNSDVLLMMMMILMVMPKRILPTVPVSAFHAEDWLHRSIFIFGICL